MPDSADNDLQEAEYLPINSRRPRSPQEAARHTTHQEDRPSLPSRPGGNRTKSQRRDHQGCTGCHPQAIQEEGKPDPAHPHVAEDSAADPYSSSPQQDDELEAPYLAGFEWDREECYTRFIVHQKKTGEAPAGGSSKKKGKKGGEEAS